MRQSDVDALIPRDRSGCGEVSCGNGMLTARSGGGREYKSISTREARGIAPDADLSGG